MSEVASALSIGAVLGSGTSECQIWERELKSLMRSVKAAREGVSSPLRVNVVFHVPSRHDGPDFDGVRVGRFSKKDSKLMIQVAIPSGPIEGDPGEALSDYLDRAVAAAEIFAKQGAIASSLPAIRGIARKVSR
jgi:hypothetical protein